MKPKTVIGLVSLFIFSGLAQGATLQAQFQTPAEDTKPWCYWYWLDGDISKEGITKDLESMARVGIKRAIIGNVNVGRAPAKPIKMLTPEWYEATHHAFKEANRAGVELVIFNGPGWSQTGGPWIKPEQSMRRVIWKEFDSNGAAFNQNVRAEGVPGGGSQDIAVLAVPKLDSVSIEGERTEKQYVFSHNEPFTARSLLVDGGVKGTLFVVRNGKRELVAKINVTLGSGKTDFLANGAQTVAFPDVKARRFELDYEAPKEPRRKKEKAKPEAPARVIISSEPMVAQVLNKQLGRMHPTPSPKWNSYIFDDTVEPKDASQLIQQKHIINLSDKLDTDGVLNCTLPKGNWRIIYFGMITTGKRNHPAPPSATGLECDKMSKKHVRHHFDSMFGKLLENITPAERAAFKGITIDSYEVGSQNWTDGFAAEFEKRNGYNPIMLLPVMTGRVIDSAKKSDQFLWDLRRTVADMIAENYVGGLRDVAHEHGLTLWCENYGHWGFPGEFLIYGAYSDEIGGEFWSNRPYGTIECRAASSAGHIYGKRRVYAEAFTSRLEYEHHPYTFKARGEELFCEGINHFVLHVYAHQARDGEPGKNPWFGTAFHRNTAWFNQSRDWVKYLQRCHHMLQQGNPVADVAVYIGDFAPQMTGPAKPVPAGYDYDYMGSDAILRKLDVVDGKWVVFDEKDPKRIAASYSLFAMPKVKYIRPEVLKRLDELKAKGGKVVNGVPVTAQTLQSAGMAPIVSETTCPIRWKARELDDGMMFFLSNFRKTGTFEATLRVKGKAAELFNPVTGEITKLARYQRVKNGNRISIDIKDKSDSCFIVFRDQASVPSVVGVQQGGKEIAPAELDLFYNADNKLAAESEKEGTYELSMSDNSKREVIIEQSSRSFAIKTPWQEQKQDEQGYSVLKETAFDLPAAFGKGQRVVLDLGQVEVMAKVTLNGKTFDTLWMPPFTLDVTDVVKSGKNTLKVLVTSTSKGQAKLGKAVQLKTVTRIQIGKLNN